MLAENAQAQIKCRGPGRPEIERIPYMVRNLSEKGGDGGNSSARLLRKIARDHPDVLARFENGEFPSVRAAARAAGIVKDAKPFDQVRKLISGHHRALAAQKAGLKEVPCWVREMSDDDAYMALALNNAQGELHPLEEGMHALGSGLSQRDYASKVGKAASTMQHRMQAAAVAAECTHMGADLREQWRALSEMHPVPRWLWRALVSRLVSESWTVETARREAQKLKEVGEA